MSLVPDTSESTVRGEDALPKQSFVSSLFHMPRNVYLLLVFTTDKGFQLGITALTLNYYMHSLGYHHDFIGVFSVVPAIGSLLDAVPTGMLADRIGRKPVLLMTAVLSPLFLTDRSGYFCPTSPRVKLFAGTLLNCILGNKLTVAGGEHGEGATSRCTGIE